MRGVGGDLLLGVGNGRTDGRTGVAGEVGRDFTVDGCRLMAGRVEGWVTV